MALDGRFGSDRITPKRDMPEETVVDGASQPTNVALDAPESSAQEPSSQLGENGQARSSEAQNGEHKAKGESRYERTKRERAEFRAQQAHFQREREAFAQERAKFEEEKKPKRDYTLADLKKYRNQWQQEGNYQLVEKADKEIAVMEAEAEAERKARTIEMPPMGTPEHRQAWETAEKELFQADPEFMRTGTRLDTKLREIMGGPDGDIYRQHPRGIVAAYHRARMELLEQDNKGLATENSKLKGELQRLTGLTSIDGGALGRVGSGGGVESVADFERLNTKDMRKHLLKSAQRGGTPWF